MGRDGGADFEEGAVGGAAVVAEVGQAGGAGGDEGEEGFAEVGAVAAGFGIDRGKFVLELFRGGLQREARPARGPPGGGIYGAASVFVVAGLGELAEAGEADAGAVGADDEGTKRLPVGRGRANQLIGAAVGQVGGVVFDAELFVGAALGGRFDRFEFGPDGGRGG